MSKQVRRLQVAKNILVANFERMPPRDMDVLELRHLAESDEERAMPLDELARRVIMREVGRTQQRAMATRA
jgi:hypothetical protein